MKPKFYMGIPYPSMAAKLQWKQFMLSFNRIPDTRQSNFEIGDWIGDCGAFTLLAKFGKFPTTDEHYAAKIKRWSTCGNLVAAVSRDWLCADPVLQVTGLSVERHQELTVESYLRLRSLAAPVYVMPTLQGKLVEDYCFHLEQYGNCLEFGQWVGVGSLVGRTPIEIEAILRNIKTVRPDLRLHGLGVDLKIAEGLCWSCDHMKWSASNRRKLDTETQAAQRFLKQSKKLTSDYAPYRKTSTSGAGNGQGRKPKWNSKTVSIRVPARFADRLLAVAREWDKKILD